MSKHANYAWTIDRVNVAELGDDMGEEVGTTGPRNIDPALLAELRRGKGHLFRMLDDDGIWYYRGRIVFAQDAGPAQCRTWNEGRSYCVNGGLGGAEDDDTGDDGDFAPLNDFGMPNAGCTEIQYRCTVTDEDGDLVKVWATL